MKKKEKMMRNDADDDKGAPNQINFAEFPMFYFATIQAQNLRNATRALAHLDITPPEWRILNLIHESPARSLSDLAEFAVIERSGASRAVTRLVDLGLLARQENKTDRRRGSLVLTDKGHDRLITAHGVMARVYDENLKGLSKEDFSTLMRCLKTIRDNTRRVEAFRAISVSANDASYEPLSVYDFVS